MFNTLNSIRIESHPFEPYIPENATSLIIGTFPTVAGKREFHFFYPNRNNLFWKNLSAIAGPTFALKTIENALEAVEHRKRILDSLNLGIADMGRIVYRQKNSSLDNSLLPIEFTDVFKLLEEHPRISKLLLTSSSGPNSVKGWLKSYFELNPKVGTFPLTNSGVNSKQGSFNFNGRTIEIVVLTSTSGAARFMKNEDKYEQYKSAIL
jgi:G:T/U-mismatch repair DNA glycosylase